MRKIVFVIISLLLLSGCSKEKRQDVLNSAQWKALGFLPYDTSYLLYVNFNDMRKKDISYLPEYIGGAESENIFGEIERISGIGIRNSISQLFISRSPNGDNVIVAFIPAGKSKLYPYLQNNSRFIQQGSGVYSLKSQKGSIFSFIDDSTLVFFNNTVYYDKVLRGNNHIVKENALFMDLLNNVSIKKSYWMVSNDKNYVRSAMGKLLGHNISERANSLLKHVESLTFAAAIENPEIEVNLKCNGKNDAFTLSTAIKTALIMDFFSKKNYELNRIMKKTEVSRDGSLVTLSLHLDNKDINQLKEITKNISGS